MTDELVADLRDLPDDWESWLVYADRLTERADPRGELLALEHRLATGAGDPEMREWADMLADDWMATWSDHLATGDGEQYRWLRSMAPLAGAPTPEELLPVFAQPVGQLLALLDPDANHDDEVVSRVFELQRDRIVAATLAWIDRAFDGVPVPDDDHRTIYQAEAADNYDSCDRSRDHLGRWQDLPEAHMLENQWAFPYLDEQGIRYYAPAVMSFALRRLVSGDTGDWIIESLGYTLAPNEANLRDHQQRRFQLFDRGQRAAIYAFVLTMNNREPIVAWGRVWEAERQAERADWFELFSPR